MSAARKLQIVSSIPNRTVSEPVGSDELKQHLNAVLAADVVGYSYLMSSDERATVAALDTARAAFKSEIETHGGRVIDMAGDSVLAVFDTATGAVDASVALQTGILARASDQPEDRKMLYRIGIHMGDIMVKTGGSVYGNVVNIAARLQSLAPPGGVAVSHSVQATVGPSSSVQFLDMGEHAVKNITDPVHVFLLDDHGNLAVHGLSPQALELAEIGNLPAQSTSLVGRADALAEVVSLLDTTRLVTLLGTGGIGKTLSGQNIQMWLLSGI